MSNFTEKRYLRICKRKIEKFLVLENDSSSLKIRDLDYLSKLIKEKSGITISSSTLKRIWKDDFAQMPQSATLNALVSILDYKDWLDFKKNNPITGDKRDLKKNTLKIVLLALPILVILTIAYIIFSKNEEKVKKPVIKGEVVFTANKTISSGVPNTVVFKYNVSNVKADSFFIQQSWNYKQKVLIDPNNTVFSSIYHVPGFHTARLIANDSVIASQDVHILSDGWMPFIMYNLYDLLPIYFNMESAVSDGYFHLNISDLKKADIDLTKEFVLRLSNSRNFGVRDDNFSVRTIFKCDSIHPRSCPKMDIMLEFEKNVFWVGLTKKGCEHYITYKIGEVYADGKSSDLSGLGCNIYEWQDLTLTVKDRHAKVMLNGNEVINVTYHSEFGELVDMTYTFDGLGSVDFISVTGADSNIVYQDSFD